jgi:hypothetical protein
LPDRLPNGDFAPGNQVGVLGRRRRPITQKLISQLNQKFDPKDPSDQTVMDKLVEKVIFEALAGDTTLIREIFDRVDGKVPQAITGPNEDDPAFVLQTIERVIVDPASNPTLRRAIEQQRIRQADAMTIDAEPAPPTQRLEQHRPEPEAEG